MEIGATYALDPSLALGLFDWSLPRCNVALADVGRSLWTTLKIPYLPLSCTTGLAWRGRCSKKTMHCCGKDDFAATNHFSFIMLLVRPSRLLQRINSRLPNSDSKIYVCCSVDGSVRQGFSSVSLFPSLAWPKKT